MHDPQHPDTWSGTEYAQHSSLQEAMASQVLALLELRGDEHVLDIGCGDGASARASPRSWCLAGRCAVPMRRST